MALLYIDGFESYGNSANSVTTANSVGNRWTAVSESAMKVQDGRTGGYAISMESSTTRIIKTDLATTNSTLVVGVGVHVGTVSGATFYPIWLKTDDSWGINVAINTNGSVSVIRNGTTLATSANTGVISANTWHYVVLKVLCDNSAGTYEVWVDGVSEVSGSGADTQEHTSKSYHNGIQLRAGNLSGAVWFDDLYILDGSGSVNNDTLGPKIVSAMLPSGDDTTDWTAQGAGDHYVEVDEVVFDEDTTYIESSTANDQDIFDYGTLVSANVCGVQVTTDCRETEAQSFQLRTLAKSTGNTVNGADQAVGTTDWQGNSIVFEEDPDGASWTPSTVNSTKFGVEVV